MSSIKICNVKIWIYLIVILVAYVYFLWNSAITDKCDNIFFSHRLLIKAFIFCR